MDSSTLHHLKFNSEVIKELEMDLRKIKNGENYISDTKAQVSANSFY